MPVDAPATAMEWFGVFADALKQVRTTKPIRPTVQQRAPKKVAKPKGKVERETGSNKNFDNAHMDRNKSGPDFDLFARGRLAC